MPHGGSTTTPTRTCWLQAMLVAPWLMMLSGCEGPNPNGSVAGWWYDGQPEGFEDQSIGGGGRPRQGVGSVTAGTRGGTSASGRR